MRSRLVVLMLSVAFAIGLCGCAGMHHEEAQVVKVPAKSIERHIEVEKLVVGSQAEGLGILPGDVILEYDGAEIETVSDLKKAIAAATAPEVKLVVRRGDKVIEMTAKPGKIGVYLRTVAKVHRMPDAKIIEGIEPLSWDSGEIISFIGCVRRVLAHYGEQHNYMYLMGISGAAFRIHFWGGWCPSSADPGCGFNCSAALLRALGRKSEEHFMKTQFHEMPGALDAEQMKQKITESIGKGVPVVAIDIVHVPEWGIITGYQNNKQDFLCRSYFDYGMEDYNIAEKTPWIALTIGEKGEALSGEEAVRQSLALAHHVGVTEKFDNYFSGTAALKAWIAALENEASFATVALAETKPEEDPCGANAWIYETFRASKPVAAEFVRTYAGVFGQMNNAALELASIYDEQAKLLEAGTESVVFPYMGDAKEWTQELRNKQAATLKEVLKLEREALELIETIMEVCEIEPYKEPDKPQEEPAP